MTQSIVVKPASQVRTCSTCPHFNNFHEPNRRGWCGLFNHQAREYHQVTNDCINSSDLIISHELKDNLAFFPNANFEELEAFPSEIVELDRDGYPMGEAAPTGYFSTDFVTDSNEPF